MVTERKLSLFMIICLIGFPQISETIYTPALPDVARSLHVSAYLAELTLGIYFVGFAIGVALWGIVADRFGRRKAMLSGLFFYILGCLGCMKSTTIDAFFLFRVLQAFGASAGSVVTMTIMRDVYSGKERAQIFATIGVALSLSPAIGPVIGGFIDEYYSWDANFVVLAVMGLVLICRCYFSLPETRPEKIPGQLTTESLSQLTWRMIKDKHVLGCALIIGACNGILFSYYAEAPFIFIELLKVPPSQYGLLGLGVAFAGFAAAMISKRLLNKFEIEKIMYIGAIVALFGAFLFTGIAMLGYIHIAHGYSALIAANIPVFIIVFGVCLMISNCLSIALKNYGHVLGTAGSVLGALYYILIALMTAAMSALHNGTVLPMPLYFLALSILLVAASRSIYLNKNREKVAVAS